MKRTVINFLAIKKRHILIVFVISLTTFCYGAQDQEKDPIQFAVDLTDQSDDTFKVSVYVSDLSQENDIYQFASTAPGTYSTMNIGRFVSNFKAFDKKGREIETEIISVNQYRLSKPRKINKIEYEVYDTWDYEVDEDPIYMMCGTSIEKDHVFFNAHAVFGFFKGLQSHNVSIELNYPDEWEIGTALNKDENGKYNAQSFDHLVDSPFLLGRLSHASITIEGTLVDVYTYSKTDLITSNQILNSLEDILLATSNYLNGLPVDRYTFLYHFEDVAQGAWEHSFSSSYVMYEANWEDLEEIMKSTSSHEFFHVVTPLNIHSEIIESFDFATPRTSDHLWFYEGVTEWAANNILFRDGQLSVDEYLKILHSKAEQSDLYFNNDVSLVGLAQNIFTEEGHQNYSNIYKKGALVAELLNIKLLELSDGKRGLREVINELTKLYGPNKPFDEADFFNVFAEQTYPEIKEFLFNYVAGVEELPYKEYFNKIGVQYLESKLSKTESKYPYDLKFSGEETVINQVSEVGLEDGLKLGDTLVSINGQATNSVSLYEIYPIHIKKPHGTELELQVKRNGTELKVKSKMLEKEDFHVFVLNPNPSPSQLELRNKWMSKLE